MIKIIINVLIIPAFFLSAQSWERSVDLNLTLTQNAYSNNWKGTELGLVSWVFNANGLLEKQISVKLNNKNTIKLSFGQTINQIKEESTKK